METPTSLVIGRGKLFFRKFVPGTRAATHAGERYFGNTPAFSIAHSKQTLERARTYGGRVVKIEPLVLSETYLVNFTTDHVSVANVTDWFGATDTVSSQAAVSAASEVLIVSPGYHYQIGVSSSRPAGRRGVESIEVRKGGSTVSPERNYRLDRASGMLEILQDAPDIAPGTTISVTYGLRAATLHTLTPGRHVVTGALRFVAENGYGPSQDYFWPMVSIQPAGDILLKGDDWQQWTFAGEALRLNPLAEYVYVTRAEPVGLSEDERYILENEGITFDEFVELEDLLDLIVNYIIPSRGYTL